MLNLNDSLGLLVGRVVVGLQVDLPVHELVVQFVQTAVGSDQFDQRLPDNLQALLLDGEEVLGVLLRVVARQASQDDHALSDTVNFGWVLQVVCGVAAESAQFGREIPGQVQSFKQAVGDFLTEGCIEHELHTVGLQEGVQEGNIILFLLFFELIIDHSPSEEPQHVGEVLHHSRPLDLELDVPVLPPLGDVDEEVDGLDGDDDPIFRYALLLPVAVVGQSIDVLISLYLEGDDADCYEHDQAIVK
jgi:hypothetical protein